jgi:hypothetical protein
MAQLFRIEQLELLDGAMLVNPDDNNRNLALPR